MLNFSSNRKLSSRTAKILDSLSRCGLISFLLGGTVITVITGEMIYMIGFTPMSLVIFALLQLMSVYIEDKFRKKNMINKNKHPIFYPEEKKLHNKYKINDHLYLNDWVTFGDDIILTNSDKEIRKEIIKNHQIIDFPGVINTYKWKPYWASKNKLENRVQYRTVFHGQPDGTIKMIWQIQPDGRYWSDEDGFGMENDKEINLYSIIDEEGKFLQPFNFYEGTIL